MPLKAILFLNNTELCRTPSNFSLNTVELYVTLLQIPVFVAFIVDFITL